MRTAKVQMNLRINVVWFGHSLFVDIYYSIHCQRTTQAQISLCQCEGWSGLSLFAKCIRVIFALRKHALWHMRPTKTHFSLRMREVWSVRCSHEETLHPWLSKNALSEDSDLTAQMLRLIYIFAVCTWIPFDSNFQFHGKCWIILINFEDRVYVKFSLALLLTISITRPS